MDLGESNYHAKNFWPGSTHLWENAIFQNSRFTHFMGTATSNGCHAHTVHQNQKIFSPIYQPRWVLQNGQQKNFWLADTHSSPYWPVVLKKMIAQKIQTFANLLCQNNLNILSCIFAQILTHYSTTMYVWRVCKLLHDSSSLKISV